MLITCPALDMSWCLLGEAVVVVEGVVEMVVGVVSLMSELEDSRCSRE